MVDGESEDCEFRGGVVGRREEKESFAHHPKRGIDVSAANRGRVLSRLRHTGSDGLSLGTTTGNSTTTYIGGFWMVRLDSQHDTDIQKCCSRKIHDLHRVELKTQPGLRNFLVLYPTSYSRSTFQVG